MSGLVVEGVEALAKVLGAISGKFESETFGAYDRRRARALLDSPAMRDLLADERAKALREAADEIHGPEAGPLIVNGRASRANNREFYGAWLRARADRERP